jgi:hypothetical protein
MPAFVGLTKCEIVGVPDTKRKLRIGSGEFELACDGTKKSGLQSWVAAGMLFE